MKKRAEALEVGEGLHIIQTFEPHPLYAVMEGLGYEHHTERRSEAEFHVWFCRVEKKEGDSSAPFKPLALLNYGQDNHLAYLRDFRGEIQPHRT